MDSNTKRRLAAIMFTDIVGWTITMTKDETKAIELVENQESLLIPIIDKYNGKIIKRTGDGYLLEYSSSVEAVECAVDIQQAIKQHNSNKDNLEFHIRIGIHLGDIVIYGDDILGEGVTIASRIEPFANPDGICMTEAVYHSVKSKMNINPTRVDEVDLKHIDDKYTLYKIPNSLNNDFNDNKSKEIKKITSKINKIENIHNLKGIFFIFAKTFFSLLPFIIIGYLGGHFSSAGFTPIPQEKIHKLLELIPKIILGLSVGSLLISAILFRRKIKLTYDDIRDVETLIDITIKQLGCEYVGKKNDKIIYVYREYPKKLRAFENWMDKTFKFIKINKTIYVAFDGNTVIFDGLNYVLFRLKRKIENYSNYSTSSI